MVVVLVLPWFALGVTLYHLLLFCTQRNDPMKCQDPPLVCCVICLTGSTDMRWGKGVERRKRVQRPPFYEIKSSSCSLAPVGLILETAPE